MRPSLKALWIPAQLRLWMDLKASPEELLIRAV